MYLAKAKMHPASSVVPLRKATAQPAKSMVNVAAADAKVSHTKHNFSLRSSGLKNIGIKGISSARSYQNDAKSGWAGKLIKKSTAHRPPKTMVKVSLANNSSEGVPAVANPSTSRKHEPCLSQTSCYYYENKQHAQTQIAKPSGLRRPSPSLGFFGPEAFIPTVNKVDVLNSIQRPSRPYSEIPTYSEIIKDEKGICKPTDKVKMHPTSTKIEPLVVSTTSRSYVTCTSHTKPNFLLRSSDQKNIGIKGISSAKSCQNDAKFGWAGNLIKMSTAHQPPKTMVKVSLANNSSEGVPAAADPSTSRKHEPCLPQTSCYYDENKQHAQTQIAKPSGLRRPSPSLGFFGPEASIPTVNKVDVLNSIQRPPDHIARYLLTQRLLRMRMRHANQRIKLKCTQLLQRMSLWLFPQLQKVM
ncbi:uncharacterized protein [Euphorbia lathyris]|uniref:uncharacterized protein n=1 Tax=Euphorbia lathyris TaxID=212925 RepID=UPI0033135011